MHELGHVLRFEDCDQEAHASELMSATLFPGVRRLCPTVDKTGETQTELGPQEPILQHELDHVATAADSSTVPLLQPTRHRRSQVVRR